MLWDIHNIKKKEQLKVYIEMVSSEMTNIRTKIIFTSFSIKKNLC